MALADRTIIPAKKGRRRRIDEVIELLDTADAEALYGWLLDPAIGSRRIADELKDEDARYSVSPGAITAYRREVLGVEIEA